MIYPSELEVPVARRAVHATVRPPGSKSITNRALVLAALGPGPAPTRLTGVLRSEDTEVMIECLRRLGYAVNVYWDHKTVEVLNPTGRVVPADSADLDCANSGTTMRFLTALVALGHGDYRLDGVPRMRERPIRDLLDALGQLGVSATSLAGTGCPPVRIHGTGPTGHAVTLRADVSSQFVSGLLMAASRAPHPVTVALEGPVVSEPYIAMTVAMLRTWGVAVDDTTPARFTVTPGMTPPGYTYAIEPDASAASYFWALPAVLGGRLTVEGLTRDSLQGDVKFVEVLARMGCSVTFAPGGITVEGGPLSGVTVDMGAISDTVMTLAAVACFAEGPTRMTNVGHIRHKETDRIAALATELRKLGVAVTEEPDAITVTPGPLKGARIETYRDHRMAMALALVGLRVPGVVILDPGCVQKTVPEFWQELFRAVSHA